MPRLPIRSALLLGLALVVAAPALAQERNQRRLHVDDRSRRRPPLPGLGHRCHLHPRHRRRARTALPGPRLRKRVDRRSARRRLGPNDDLEAGGRWGFASIDPDFDDGETGLRDLGAYARYRLPLQAEFDAAVGAEFTLPVGSEDVGGGNFDFRGFGALRTDVDGNLTLIGSAGLESVEVGDDRELGLFLGGGTIVPLTEELAVIAELDLSTATDLARLTGGLDYELPPGGHLRGAIALGLDDDAPNFELILGFAIPVY